MSIQGRVQDAEFLWQHKRYEGALLNALAAVAATSRLRYPDRKTVKDGEAFEQFLKAAQSVSLRFELRGELQTIEHILYKFFRCELVHEGGLPIDVEFVLDTEPGALWARAGGSPEFIFQLSQGWFHYLIRAVVSAPENKGAF